jgi:hypothetical protein
MTPDAPALETIGFLVDERPYCVVDWDLSGRNLEFISQLDPGYFRFLAETFTNTGPDKQMHAALAVRTAYSHALEAFMAVVGATVQSPNCVPGWFLKAWQKDLESVAEKITRQQGLPNKLCIQPLNWSSFSEAVMSLAHFDSPEKRKPVVDGFATAWTRLAHDFLNRTMYEEYNNIKHGFRISLGGFTLAVGEEHTYGVAPPDNEMRTLGGSKFGSSFFVPEQVGGPKNHFRLRRTSRNWSPGNLLDGLALIEISMKNILSFLKAINGVDPKTLEFRWPEDPNALRSPWQAAVGVNDFNMDFLIKPTDVQIFSDDQIRAIYSNAAITKH